MKTIDMTPFATDIGKTCGRLYYTKKAGAEKCLNHSNLFHYLGMGEDVTLDFGVFSEVTRHFMYPILTDVYNRFGEDTLKRLINSNDKHWRINSVTKRFLSTELPKIIGPSWTEPQRPFIPAIGWELELHEDWDISLSNSYANGLHNHLKKNKIIQKGNYGAPIKLHKGTRMSIYRVDIEDSPYSHIVFYLFRGSFVTVPKNPTFITTRKTLLRVSLNEVNQMICKWDQNKMKTS